MRSACCQQNIKNQYRKNNLDKKAVSAIAFLIFVYLTTAEKSQSMPEQ